MENILYIYWVTPVSHKCRLNVRPDVTSLLFCWSVAKSYPSLCSPVKCSTLIFPVLHYLSKFAQIHHRVGDDIAPLNRISFCLIYWSLSSAHQQGFMNLRAAGALKAANGLLCSLSFLSCHILHQSPTYPKCGSCAAYREWVTMFNKSQPIPLGCSSLSTGQKTGREHSTTHENKTQIPHSQCLLSGIFHKLLILICERADRMNIIITEN